MQVVKIVRAIRKGWVSFDKKPEKPRVYLLWEDDFKTADKTANGLTYIPAPKPKLPGEKHEKYISCQVMLDDMNWGMD